MRLASVPPRCDRGRRHRSDAQRALVRRRSWLCHGPMRASTRTTCCPVPRVSVRERTGMKPTERPVTMPSSSMAARSVRAMRKSITRPSAVFRADGVPTGSVERDSCCWYSRMRSPRSCSVFVNAPRSKLEAVWHAVLAGPRRRCRQVTKPSSSVRVSMPSKLIVRNDLGPSNPPWLDLVDGHEAARSAVARRSVFVCLLAARRVEHGSLTSRQQRRERLLDLDC